MIRIENAQDIPIHSLDENDAYVRIGTIVLEDNRWVYRQERTYHNLSVSDLEMIRDELVELNGGNK